MPLAFKTIAAKGVSFKIKHFTRYYFWMDSFTTIGFIQHGKIDGYRTLTELRRDLHTTMTYCTTEGRTFFITKSVPIIQYAKNNHKTYDNKSSKTN